MVWFRRSFYLLIAVAVLQVIVYYPQLPEIVASHFDSRGAPNGWSSKRGFFGLYLVIVLVLAGIFAWMPKWLETGSGRVMRIPNRDYWMAPERRAGTWAFIRRQMMAIANWHLLLAIVAVQLAIQANFVEPARLHPGIGWALAIYFIVFIAWLARFLLYFKKPS